MREYLFITAEQVRADCQNIGLSDWSRKTDGQVDEREAEIVQKIVGGEACEISVAEFAYGLEVELEHGVQFPDANVSANHPIATGRIVLAHLKESLDYYQRLQCMELEMELATALENGDFQRAVNKRVDLAAARAALETRIGEQLAHTQ